LLKNLYAAALFEKARLQPRRKPLKMSLGVSP
jgi:hypothetical protein